ncbi:hypothetical protein E2562_037281 [Oryza meyeriana var. granulata]|uniref:Uncharacterized protein n=1 Tax=Oryza meyeriana var. granulata TaxID=110450 RepID=A0A6G1C274_9ORYZ|nr:hypothetical protein E2562_037281 [Oryza meyeriana var. granulata]
MRPSLPRRIAPEVEEEPTVATVLKEKPVNYWLTSLCLGCDFAPMVKPSNCCCKIFVELGARTRSPFSSSALPPLQKDDEHDTDIKLVADVNMGRITVGLKEDDELLVIFMPKFQQVLDGLHNGLSPSACMLEDERPSLAPGLQG